MECPKYKTRFASTIRTIGVSENIICVQKNSLKLWCNGVCPAIRGEKSQKPEKSPKNVRVPDSFRRKSALRIENLHHR